ncbi:MAG: GNAT family protein [Thermodesulfobacteriota bacterium]|nr:GNAT family protein [Thermodesulfobacteriota bacterium]
MESFMIIPCTDKEDIAHILNHPRVYGWIIDIRSPKEYEPIIHESALYLMDETKAGVIRIDPMNGITCCAHIAALPGMWGKTKEFVKEAIRWGFANTGYMKATAFIPIDNKLAIKLARDVGMVQEGILTKSYLRNWKLLDQIIFGLCKGDISWGS